MGSTNSLTLLSLFLSYHLLSPTLFLTWLRSLPVVSSYGICVPVTCAAHSLVIRPSPIAKGRAADPAMAAGVHVPWRLRSSSAEPRAPTSVSGAGGARAPPLVVGSHPDD
jgi:hypothetical protein